MTFKNLYAFVTEKLFARFLKISTTSSIPLKTFNSELLYIQLWFPDQNIQPVEIEYRINLTLVIK